MERSILYLLTALTATIHFLVIVLASKLNTYQLGLYSLFITFFAFAFLVAQFDGSYLCISKVINVTNYLKWNRSTNTFLFFILLISSYILFSNSYFITLSILLTTCLSSYSIWAIDVSTIKERIKKNEDYGYRSKIVIQTIFIRILIPLLLLLIFSLEDLNYIFLKIFISLIFLMLFYISYKKIGFLKFDKIICNLPPLSYFLPLVLRKADNSLFIFAISSLLGIEALGRLQVPISLSRSINIFTYQFLRVEYIKFFSNKFLRRILIINAFTYFIYSIIPIFIFKIISIYGYLNYVGTIFVLILLFLYHGNDNTKLLLHSINLSFKKYKINTIDRLFYISLKSLVLILPIIFPYLNLSLNMVLAMLIVPDLIFSFIRYLQICKKVKIFSSC